MSWGLMWGVIYAIVYFLLAFGAAGAGHGTYIFFAAILPYGIGLLIFPAVGFLAGDLKSFLSKVLYVSLVIIHYALVVNFLRFDWVRDPEYTEKMWNYYPLAILLPAGFYLVGQIVIWALFIRCLIADKESVEERMLDHVN